MVEYIALVKAWKSKYSDIYIGDDKKGYCHEQ